MVKPWNDNFFFAKKIVKTKKTKPPTPRTFNKTCLQHEVLTKCCHPVAFFRATQNFCNKSSAPCHPVAFSGPAKFLEKILWVNAPQDPGSADNKEYIT